MFKPSKHRLNDFNFQSKSYEHWTVIFAKYSKKIDIIFFSNDLINSQWPQILTAYVETYQPLA